MKALVLKGINDLEVQDVPEPKMAPDQIKVKIAYCGICGSDVHMVEGKMGFGARPEWMIGKAPVGMRMSFPRVMGHEASGTIAEIGKDVKGDFKVGQKVGMDFKAYCGSCWYCNNMMQGSCLNRKSTTGSMAEYAIYPEGAVYPLVEGVSLDVGALLEPLTIAVHTMDIAQIRSGDAVIITGAGPIGLLIMQMAMKSGASKVLVSEPVADKRRLAKELGADVVVDPLKDDLLEASNKLTDYRGFSVCFEASGRPEVARQLLYLAESAGTVVWAAVYPQEAEVGVSPSFMYSRELKIHSVRVSPYAFPRAVQLMPKLNLKPLISVRELDDAVQAFADQKAGKGVKILLHPKGGPV
jgi:(R,R)-butanediol dehydrogenase/meso-butanediol dehydrogenase/diacetyl reductase/L-iditol 2-dehydrogenase